MQTSELSRNATTIQSADLWARLDELDHMHQLAAASADEGVRESLLADDDEEEEASDPQAVSAYAEVEPEHEELRALEAQLRFRRGSGDSFSLIREDHLQEWCRQFAANAMRMDYWPMTAINWTLAATQMAGTMGQVEFDGIKWYVTL